MHNSPSRTALLYALLFGLLASFWVTFTHMGPPVFMVIDAHNIHHDAPADAAFAAVTTVMLFFLMRYHFARQAEAHEALRRSHEELEQRVQQRTQALNDEREKLLGILDAMPDGVCIINPRHEIEYANPTMVEQWGPIGDRKCYSYFMGRTEPCEQCRKPEILAGSVVRWERTSADGERTFELVGTPIRSVEGEDATLQIVRDVTERQSAAREQARLLEQIDEERHLLQAVIENTPASIALFDGVHQRVRWANLRYFETLNEPLRSGDISGLTVADLYPDNMREQMTHIFSHVLTSGRAYVNPEFYCQRPGSDGIYWNWSLLPLPVDSASIPDLLLVAHEITDQVMARKRIEEMSAEAKHRADELHRAHAELSYQARELATLLDISHNVASTLLSQPLLDVVLDQIKVVIDYGAATVYTVEGDGITAVAYRGPLPDVEVLGFHIPMAHAPGFQELLQQRIPVIVDDIYGDAPFERTLMAAANAHFSHTLAGTRSWLGIPLIVKDRVIGMLRLDHPEANYFTVRAAQLALAIANQAAVAMENARLYEEARKVATLEERQRMARELHDSVSQALYGIALGTHAAREQLERAPQKLSGTLEYILNMSATAVAEMRALVFELRPESLEQEGLVAALTRQADAVRARAGVTMCVDLCEEPGVSLDVKEALYRIAQEALHNIVKHAYAQSVSVSLCTEGNEVVLVVADDGRGFDPDGRFPGHLGLRTMHERAVRLGGALEITGQEGGGSRVRASIPAGSPAAGRNGRVHEGELTALAA